MPDQIASAAAMLGVEPISESLVARSRRDIERQLGRHLPDSLASLLQFPGVMDASAKADEATAIFPNSVRFIDRRSMPGFEEDLLWLMCENQGVCNWGVSLTAGDDPPILVGGELEMGELTTEYARTVGDFVWTRAWDLLLMSRTTLIQAQADEIGDQTLAMLGARFSEGIRTSGWPARINRRYEGRGGLMLLIWSGKGQCDWWISSEDSSALEQAILSLRSESNLETALWSNDAGGAELLTRLRVGGSSLDRPRHMGDGPRPDGRTKHA